MRYIGQTIVIASAILAGASLDGWRCGWFGFGGLCIRLAVFSCIFVAGLVIEHKAYRRKKTKRKNRLNGSSTGSKNNKYSVICHS